MAGRAGWLSALRPPVTRRVVAFILGSAVLGALGAVALAHVSVRDTQLDQPRTGLAEAAGIYARGVIDRLTAADELLDQAGAGRADPVTELANRALPRDGARCHGDDFARRAATARSAARPWLCGRADGQPAARKICPAAIGMAAGLELMAIATGIDSEQRRARLAALGCTEGLGDLYAGDFRSEAQSAVAEERRRSAKAART